MTWQSCKDTKCLPSVIVIATNPTPPPTLSHKYTQTLYLYTHILSHFAACSSRVTKQFLLLVKDQPERIFSPPSNNFVLVQGTETHILQPPSFAVALVM